MTFPARRVRSVVIAVCVGLALSISACVRHESGPIADSTMVDLLIDLHLLNAREQTLDKPTAAYRDSLLQRHGVDSAAYARTMLYFADHPVEYADIYGRVVDRLTAERAPMSFTDSIQATLESNALSP